jgi:hypothetical protein
MNTFSNLLATKKGKQPDFSNMSNDVTVSIYLGHKKQEWCNRLNFYLVSNNNVVTVTFTPYTHWF